MIVRPIFPHSEDALKDEHVFATVARVISVAGHNAMTAVESCITHGLITNTHELVRSKNHAAGAVVRFVRNTCAPGLVFLSGAILVVHQSVLPHIATCTDLTWHEARCNGTYYIDTSHRPYITQIADRYQVPIDPDRVMSEYGTYKEEQGWMAAWLPLAQRSAQNTSLMITRALSNVSPDSIITVAEDLPAVIERPLIEKHGLVSGELVMVSRTMYKSLRPLLPWPYWWWQLWKCNAE